MFILPYQAVVSHKTKHTKTSGIILFIIGEKIHVTSRVTAHCYQIGLRIRKERKGDCVTLSGLQNPLLYNKFHHVFTMARDNFDHVADEIRGYKARVALQLDESTDVSNCTCL